MFKTTTLPMVLIAAISYNNNAEAEFVYSGQNKLTLEYYDVKGDDQNGLYPFEGSQSFNDLSISFSDTYSVYRSMRGYILSSSNNSDYRGDDGTNVSNAAVTYENGESSVPYRLEVGDFFASQSRHTLQRGLKGLQIELQPQTTASPFSIQFFAGRSSQDYNTFFEGDKDYFYGGSFLSENKKLGAFAITSVNYHSLKSNGNTTENVSSVAWQNDFKYGDYTHSVETELSYLRGSNATTNSLDGTSQFLQFSGRNQRNTDYLVRLERNDKQFKPVGASVTADRETVDLQWGTGISKNLILRLRSQQFRDNYDSSNISTSKIYGANISGLPFSSSQGLIKGLNAVFDVYQQNDSDEDRSFDRENRSLQLNLSLPINSQWRSRASYQRLNTDDNVAANTSTRESLSAGVDYLFKHSKWSGTFSPTFRLSKDTDVSSNTTTNVALGFLANASKNGHRILLSHQFINFQATDPSATELMTVKTRIEWQKDWNKYSLIVGYDHLSRDPDGKADTDSSKMSVAWVYRFDKTQEAKSIAAVTQDLAITSFRNIDDLKIGARFDGQVKDLLKSSNYIYQGNSGRYQLFEGKLFPNISNRQVLAIETRVGSIETANILIPISRNQNAAQQTYKRFLDELLTKFGSPTLNIDRGDFDANWISNLQENKFSRIIEWQTDSGILRFGIPRPKSGQVRIELQLRRQQPSANSNDWGLAIIL